MRLLTPEALLRRLGGHLDLRSGRTDLAERQQTLRATIDWSYDLLDARERTVFCRFSVFAGGATLDAAEGVCAEPDEPDILTTLAGLLDKSLLVDTDDPRGGEPRLRMLETVRSYAWEKLVERGEADDLRRRHLACFSALGRYAHPYLCGPGQRDWSARLDPERTNIRAAINAGLEMRGYGVALQLTWDTFVYYYIRDAFQEPREWIDRIAAHRSHLDEVERAKLDVALAIVGNAPEGFDVRSRLAAAVPVLEADGLRLEPAVAHFYMGLANWQAGDAPAAIRALRASSARLRRHRPRLGRGDRRDDVGCGPDRHGRGCRRVASSASARPCAQDRQPAPDRPVAPGPRPARRARGPHRPGARNPRRGGAPRLVGAVGVGKPLTAWTRWPSSRYASAWPRTPFGRSPARMPSGPVCRRRGGPPSSRSSDRWPRRRAPPWPVMCARHWRRRAAAPTRSCCSTRHSPSCGHDHVQRGDRS